MKITIHQPEHLVWLGLLDKISQAQKYVALDTVQYRKLYFQNRNRILTSNGMVWLTVPLRKDSHKTLIKDVEISYDQNWTKKYLGLIENSYRKTQYFDHYYTELKEIILRKSKLLVSLNMDLLRFLLKHFDIFTEVIMASSLDTEEAFDGTDVNLNICKTLNADTYLSGPFGKDYLDLSRFGCADVNVVFHEFQHPEYKQLFEPFVPGASAIDLLFNYGPVAKEILFSLCKQERV